MNTYEKYFAEFGLTPDPLCGVDEDGEDVIVSIDDDCACVKTLQGNGWIRTNIYHRDGTVEELYQR